MAYGPRDSLFFVFPPCRFWNTLKGEPDNNETGGAEGEDCAVVDSYTESWYDVPCDFTYPRVCQKAAEVLP